MRKSTRVLKRLLSLFLVVLISINSYAAIVGDNDGAAFVTKAEFDSLRNTFDAQINQYNSSIDNKIDGAIGSYLAGVKTNDKPYVMMDDVKGSIGQDLRFRNTKSVGVNFSTQYIVNKEKTYSYKFTNKDLAGWKFEGSIANILSDYNGLRMVGIRMPSGSTYCAKVVLRQNKRTVTTLTTQSNSSCFVCLVGDTLVSSGSPMSISGHMMDTMPVDGQSYTADSTVTFNRTGGWWNANTWGNNSQQKYFVLDWENVIAVWSVARGMFVCWQAYTPSGVLSVSSTFPSSSGASYLGDAFLVPAKEEKNHAILSSSWTSAGSGNAWTALKLANGKYTLLDYRQMWPLVVLNYSSHWYKSFGEVTLAANVFNYTDAHSKTLSPPTSWGYATSGTRYTAYNESDNGGFWYMMLATLLQGTQQMQYVQTDQWSSDFNNSIKWIDVVNNPTAAASAISSNLTWAQSTHELEGFNQNLGAINMTMNGVQLSASTSNMDTFEHLYLTGIAGEVVYMGGGAPLMRMRAEQSTEYTVKMDLLSRNSSGTAANSTVTVRLSYKQFKDGNFAATTDRIYEANVSCNSSGKGTATFDITGIPKDSIVWYSLLSATQNYTAECTKCTVTIK